MRSAAKLTLDVSLLVLLLFTLSGALHAAAESQTAHPVVVGFERFFTANSTNLAAGGELLFSELRCVNCHQPGRLKERFPSLSGPRLDDLPARLNFDYLIDWLSNPQTTKPGTIMPHLLSGNDEPSAREDATALAYYLFSIRQFPKSGTPAKGSIENGRRLFHSVGCVACHAPDPAVTPSIVSEDTVTEEVKVPSVPLGQLQRKYSHAGLVDFLIDPLKWRPDGRMPRTPLGETEAGDIAAYLLNGGNGGGSPALLPHKLVTQGGKRFAELGCGVCHSLGKTDMPAAVPKAKPLLELSAAVDQGCLAEAPASGVPDYQLDALQREALAAALKNLSQAKPLSGAQRIERHMLALNCYACHERAGRGGPEAGRAAFFETTGADLEDEGRFPPRLTGVGRKLTTTALEEIIQGNGTARAYMTTRMPDFGVEHAKLFSEWFTQADLTPDIKPTPRDDDHTLIGRAPWGRELIGSKGISCISCHSLNGHKSLGIGAMDLALAPRRLRPEWFRDYLINPAAFRPGTRMPSFWPDGKAAHPLLGRNTTRQIDSLWVYLTELDQNRLPEGMEKKDGFELKPTGRPIVFRTFMKDAGLHAIAVGYPQNVHVAFDSAKMEWVLAWRGRFLDAEGTWDDRFAPLAQPLGTNVLKLTSGPSFVASGIGGPSRMKGYRLDEKGIPTFFYSYGGMEIEDRVEPNDPEGKSLKRTIHLSRGETDPKWRFVAATGRQITAQPDQSWRVEQMQIRIIKPEAVKAEISEAEPRQLLVPVDFGPDGTATIILELAW